MIGRWLLALALLIGMATGALAAGPHIITTLDAETLRPAPGSNITLALVMRPAPTWHGYWENPGDAGLPTDVTWALPKGVTVGPLRYPVPQRLLIQGLMNYVYERPYALLMTLRVPASSTPGTALHIAGKARWLACSPIVCVPEQAPVAVDLIVGDGKVAAVTRSRFDGWRAALPLPLSQRARFETKGAMVRVAIPFPASRPVASPYFYPSLDGAIDYAAPQAISRNGDWLIVETKARADAKPVAALPGVIAIGPDRGLSLTAVHGVVPAAGAAVTEGRSEGGKSLLGTMLLALGGAILGGLLLNVMPCVFPILSLKALSLARQGEGNAAARTEAVAYTAGVILCCVALGGLLLLLRAGGEAAGWAFQLQDPRIILLLFLLVTAISLNLAGLFELNVVSIGENLTRGQGASSSFWTGALAAFVATPCTGPFMAGALGVALVLPPVAALAIFVGLGFGLALPFLLLGFIPALRRALPKPGAWMNTMRHIMAVPMFLTAIGLAWILGRQTGIDGMTVGLGLAVLLGLALWWTGARQLGGKRFGWAPLMPILALVAVAVVTIPRNAPADAASGSGERFDEAKLDALVAAKKPVFVYFTADWCLTCKVNEKAAIERDEVRSAFAAKGVTTMIGDWTDGDAAIGRFLEAHGRSGVPLYLFYHADGRVEELPQVLTPGLLAALPNA